MLSSFGYFLLSQWLWNVTWGVYHIPLNIFFMYMFLRITQDMGKLHLLALTIGANIFSAVVYSAFVVGVLIFGCGLQYLPSQCPVFTVYGSLQASLFVGAIYAVIQGVFFLLLPRRYSMYWIHALGFAIISNLMASIMVYKMLPTY
ncbi:hypothetical protein Noda2021_00410 [Candidatus Dependentiae bacterium Noda2021]|nr:hypothetical protein Noda2021_00410 [Candidatus Dependentiae bacterium Noda2021]